MPKSKKSKREAILDAMLDVVVERGFHEAPMSLVSERAGASAGVIYHYFASKEEIIQSLYERIHALKRSMLLEGYSPEKDSKQVFIQLWVNGYNFYRKHSREMRFLEQYDAAGFACRAEDGGKGSEQIDFERRFRGRSKGGVFKDWPQDVTAEMTLGLVARLAKLPKTLKPSVVLEIAETMWEAVKAP